ncbi:hypothetical protein M569_03389 [Genlisea aurea]|uniref:Glycine-rich protein n=1 Tax=Genlisea aurea TaxID=192259 RepID=S8EFK9_9LAMI|nr:hypothetical protein M569_03389 [Genlisea aurea]
MSKESKILVAAFILFFAVTSPGSAARPLIRVDSSGPSQKGAGHSAETAGVATRGEVAFTSDYSGSGGPSPGAGHGVGPAGVGTGGEAAFTSDYSGNGGPSPGDGH